MQGKAFTPAHDPFGRVRIVPAHSAASVPGFNEMGTLVPPWGLWRLCLSSALLLAAAVQAYSGVVLREKRGAGDDLEVTGLLAGVAPGESRFVRWSDLRALPTETISVEGEFVPGEQKLTVLWLTELLAQLPISDKADVVLATCTDGYAAVFKFSFVQAYRPFLVLEINGEGPAKWPPAGLTFNPGPYVISISPQFAPKQPALLDAGHKRPWGVSRLEIAHYADRFSGVYTGNWSTLSARAGAGRDLWVNSCASCHAGPKGTFGGTKAQRAFQVLVTSAQYNPTYFKSYVRDPKSIASGAKMEPHPHYTDAQLDALIAFITAEPAK